MAPMSRQGLPSFKQWLLLSISAEPQAACLPAPVFVGAEGASRRPASMFSLHRFVTGAKKVGVA